jgi:hypothetical protein
MAKFKTAAKKSAATPEPKGKRGSTTEGDDEAAPRTGVNIGKTSGMRIMAFQDQTMADQHKNHLTDEELAAKWQAEFPNSRARFEERLDIVRTVRRLFNEKRHGNQQLDPPDGGVKRYELQNGRRVAVDEPKRGRGQTAAEPTSKAADTGRGRTRHASQ